MQRIVSADQLDSLFVPAFAREIFETLKEKGLAARVNSSACNRYQYASSVVSSTDTKMLTCLKQMLLN